MPPAQVARRVRFVARTNGFDPARRRLEAYPDRDYFYFLEFARRTLPPATEGIAFYTSDNRAEDFYLAVYQLAPLEVRRSPPAVPRGWIALFWKIPPPPDWTVVRSLPGGVFARPPAAP